MDSYTSQPAPGGRQSTLDKALTLMSHLASAGEPMTITEISSYLQVSRGTAYSIVRTMMAHDYLAQKDDHRYFLSYRCFFSGQAFRLQYGDLLPCNNIITRFFMNDPPAWLKVCDLFILQPGGMLFALVQCFPNMLFDYTALTILRSQRLLPWYANAAGYILVAFAEPEQRRQCLNLLDEAAKKHPGLPDRVTVENELDRVRHDFFFADTGDLLMMNEATVATPVFTVSGTPSAALCFTVPADAYHLQERKISDTLRNLTQQLSINLGYHPFRPTPLHPNNR